MKYKYLLIPTLTVLPVAGADKLSPQANSSVEQSYHEQILSALLKQTSPNTKVLPELHPKRTTFNAEAPIPPQCYTRTEGQFNPCYVCHQNQREGGENTMNDGSLQLAYAFSDVGMTNHWANLFEDRSREVSEITDAQIDQWVSTDNYTELADRLKATDFEGWIPDLKNLHLGAAAFDEFGFARDGSHWVAFNYKPLPSTFWPTNGSTDDVMIRLDSAFRQTADGEYSADIYRANLAILEARIKGKDTIATLPANEQVIQKDLNGDGILGVITTISDTTQYVGGAAKRYVNQAIYPIGTEFLHTVRYVGIGENDSIEPSTRMKEVRYMRKWKEYGQQTYARRYELENFGKEQGRLPRYLLLGDKGLDNGFGWSIAGFIEDANGQLRTLTYEENLACMGCHSSVGATIDKTFSFPRKVDGATGWKYIDLKGMPDAPNKGEREGEIATYLRRVGGGGEFRNNAEMFARWFDSSGAVSDEKLARAKDVYDLITPSAPRARQLNKAYRTIVANQDYIYGRDALVKPPMNVFEHIDNETAPTLPAQFFYSWDIRLDWSALE